MVPHAEVGDHRLVHVGVAISIVDEEESQKSFQCLAKYGPGQRAFGGSCPPSRVEKLFDSGFARFDATRDGGRHAKSRHQHSGVPGIGRVRPGVRIIVSGNIATHRMAIMLVRGNPLTNPCHIDHHGYLDTKYKQEHYHNLTVFCGGLLRKIAA